MCLIVFAHQISTNYPLVLSANRDEFFSRDTREAAFWEKEAGYGHILAGKDLKAGGTWLGVTLDGKFAAVTNLRNGLDNTRARFSRGHLSLKYLVGGKSPKDFAEIIAEDHTDYCGFNLLLGNNNEAVFFSSKEKSISVLKPGIYGFSNGSLNSNWPKVTQGKRKLSELLENDKRFNLDMLIHAMNDCEVAADGLLPKTGIPKTLEKQLSSIFVSDSDRIYGTRCSTALMTSHTEPTRFAEQNYDEYGNPTNSHYFEFPISKFKSF